MIFKNKIMVTVKGGKTVCKKKKVPMNTGFRRNVRFIKLFNF